MDHLVSLSPDDVLADRYRIERRLGRGGMAEVFAAEDRTLGREVAVKVLAAHLLDDPHARERLRREARTAAALNHPHIVGLYDIVADGGTDFLVMELVAGPSLADRIREDGRFVVDEALDVARQVADGLAAAHDRGLVHRDIKPSNILFDADGKAKIADFGIARAVETSATMTAGVRGSVPYIAPEQAGGDPPDPRSDLYTLGCVLFEMLTGQPPFTADTTAAVLGQHLHRDPPEASSLNPDVPTDLDAVVSRLLAKQPDRRHPDATTLSHDLQRVAAGQPPAPDTREHTRVLSPATTVRVGSAPDDDPTAILADRQSSDDPDRDVRSPPWRFIVTAAVVGAALLAVLATGTTRDATDPRAAETPGSTPTATPSPTATSASTPTDAAQPPAPTDPQQAASQIRQALAEGRDQGQISARGVEEIERRLAEALEKHEEGKDKEVTKKIEEMRKKLDEFLDHHEIDPNFAERLRQRINDLQQAIT